MGGKLGKDVPNNAELKVIENSNEWVNWIEEAIAKNYFKHYEYKNFSNIQEIGTGDFGKVYRANWKKSNKYFALKSFFDFNNATIKEFVHELKLHREVDFHDNVIRFYGITYEYQNDQKKYLIVMEYADGGTLRNYLKEHFDKLTWGNKLDFALQLAHAVSCLHGEGIIHRDLHPKNVLVHLNSIKLADFGLSKRIEVASNTQSKLNGIIPYVDPKKFISGQRNRNKIYSLNEKSDVYSVGMILWEISSGKPPFYIEGEPYGIELALEILQGLKETIVPNTPTDYANLYTECWDNEPDNRPTMDQVVERLKLMVSVRNQSANDYQIVNSDADFQLQNEQPFSSNNNETSSNTNNSLQGELSKLIQNFDKMNTNEMVESLTSPSKQIIDKNNLFENKFSKIVDEIVDMMIKLLNNGKEFKEVNQSIFDYFNNHNTDSQEIYIWLSNDQNNSNSIFLLGYFNYSGIGIDKNHKEAFNLFINASGQNHMLAQYYVGVCYKFGHGTVKDEKLAFEYYKKIANKDFVEGEFRVGCCYELGIGIEKDGKLANYWYKKAASGGHVFAIFNLGNNYRNGNGVEKDYNKAFELFKKSAEGEYADGIMMLGYCYSNGIGTNIDKQKAFELYQKAANLGHSKAQNNLALMYENGDGIVQDIDQAIYWYEKAVEQGYQKAQSRVERVLKIKNTENKH